ncbi:MAG TPA: MotA/TolQ/ExbB proton channel family protein [Rhodothermales bacterium]|nr:MotA/TolQ/ExbB proton channel family protein [Rhodothermales bacterium]
MTVQMLFFQSVALPVDTLAAQAGPGAGQYDSYLDMILAGGWVMIPIFLLSVLSVYIFVERFITLRKASTRPQAITERIRQYVHSGDIRGAIVYCEAQGKPITNIIKTGLERLGRPISDIQDAVQAAGRYEAFELERKMDVLASVAGIAPMLGFLGTVTGMIKAFQAIQQLQGAVDPSQLAGGIWEALITTVFGLVVGIAAYFFHNWLTSRIGRAVNDMERSATDFIDLLQEPAPRPVSYEMQQY